MKQVLAAATGIALLSWTLAIAESLPPPICGDVNDSGSVNTSDALLVLKKGVGQDVSLPCERYGTSIAACQGDLFAVMASLSAAEQQLALTQQQLGSAQEQLASVQEQLTSCIGYEQVRLTFTSTVTDSGSAPAGATGLVTFLVEFNTGDAASAAPFGDLDGECGGILCYPTAWTFSVPFAYTVSYSGGLVSTGTIDRIEFFDAGFSGGIFKDDQIRFFDGFTEIWGATARTGLWLANPSDLSEALTGIDEPGTFDLTHHEDEAGWTTYHLDFLTFRQFTEVTRGP